jgi:hypothetical protein
MKATYVIVRGFALLMVSLLTMLNIIFIANLNPNKSKMEEALKPAGTLNVYLSWPDGDTDVDVWVTGPKDGGKPVGFTNLKGKQWSLLRDDTGASSDGARNFENAFARDVTAGKYVINAHCFRCSSALPFDTLFEVWLDTPGIKNPVKVFKGSISFTKSKQEKTVVVFELDAKAKIVPGSIHSVYTPLISGVVK